MPPREHLALSGGIFDCHSWELGGVEIYWNLVSRGHKSYQLSYNAHDNFPQQIMIWCEISVEPRLRNFTIIINDINKLFYCAEENHQSTKLYPCYNFSYKNYASICTRTTKVHNKEKADALFRGENYGQVFTFYFCKSVFQEIKINKVLMANE